MTDHPIHLFADDATIRRVGEGLLDASLPRAERTDEAHLAACRWPLRFYLPDRQFSVAARRAFVPPDLSPIALEQGTSRAGAG